MDITPALEDYLEAVLILKEKGMPVRVKDVAALLDVKAPSVIDALSHLKRKHFVIQKPYRAIELTPKGRMRAAEIYSRHKNLKKFFHRIVGLSEGTADTEACRIEHYLDRDTIKKILHFTDHYIARQVTDQS